jgi:hypothetical protein
MTFSMLISLSASSQELKITLAFPTSSLPSWANISCRVVRSPMRKASRSHKAFFSFRKIDVRHVSPFLDVAFEKVIEHPQNLIDDPLVYYGGRSRSRAGLGYLWSECGIRGVKPEPDALLLSD